MSGTITVVFEGGVLRPEQALSLPEHTRLEVTIQSMDVTPESEDWARAEFRRLREQGGVRLNGWQPTRDEMHERG